MVRQAPALMHQAGISQQCMCCRLCSWSQGAQLSAPRSDQLTPAIMVRQAPTLMHEAGSTWFSRHLLLSVRKWQEAQLQAAPNACMPWLLAKHLLAQCSQLRTIRPLRLLSLSLMPEAVSSSDSACERRWALRWGGSQPWASSTWRLSLS